MKVRAGLIAVGAGMALAAGSAAYAGPGRAAVSSTDEVTASTAAKHPKACRTKRQRRSIRCRTEQIGRPGRVIDSPRAGRGGVGDQHLPFDTGRAVKVSQGNNYYVSHNNVYTRYGWDFAVSTGTSVRATMAGTVVRAQSGWNGGWGTTVLIRVADGTCARFGHLSSLAVAAGQQVGRYGLVGRSGNTGNSGGPHLHYQREHCSSGAALPSSFVEAGIPAYPQVVTSRNAAEPPPAPEPPPPPLQPVVPALSPTPAPVTGPPNGNPTPAPVDRTGVTSMNFTGQGNYWAYTWWAWDQFVARSNTLTNAGVVVGNPNLATGAAVPYSVRIRLCSSQPDANGNCATIADRSPQVINYGLSADDLGDISVQVGQTYWILVTMPPKVSGRDWDTFWARTRSGRPPGQRDSIGQTVDLNAIVRGFNR